MKAVFLFVTCVLLAGCRELKVREKPKPLSVEQYAAKLRRDHDSLHIYQLSETQFEVWFDGVGPKKWRDASTIDGARKIVDDYYLEWAKSCVGEIPPGRKIE